MGCFGKIHRSLVNQIAGSDEFNVVVSPADAAVCEVPGPFPSSPLSPVVLRMFPVSNW